MKLLMISSDRKILEKGSATAQRQIEYAKNFEEVHIVVLSTKTDRFSGEEFKETSIVPNVWVYPTRSISRFMYVIDALRLGKFIAEKREITNITCQDPFEIGLVGALLKNRYRLSNGASAELELQIHTDIGSSYFRNFNILNRIRTAISGYALSRADSVRVVSERIKKYITKYLDESKIYIKPIAVDLEKIKSSPITDDIHFKYPQFSKIVLMVSRLEKEKNISMAIKAFANVKKLEENAGLVIVGEGSLKESLQRLAKSLGLSNSVIFEGWKSDTSSLYSYYKTCDCFLSTSWYEGYGMSLAEASASGCKIVSTDVGIAREVGARIVGFEDEEIAKSIINTILNT